VIFAFLGEGAPLSDQGDRLCYFASDSTVKDRARNAVSTSDIAQGLDKLKSQRFCALIDVNFRGFTAGRDNLAGLNLENTPYKEFLGSEGKEEHTPAPGRVVFLATSGGVPSIDLERHGLFTQLLLDGLSGKADKEGYEPDGVVTAEELAAYLDRELPELARTHGKTGEEKEQRHFVLGGRPARFALTRNPAVAAKVQERLDRLAAAKDVPANLQEEGRRLLSLMPRLEAERSLRKEYQKLADGLVTLDAFRGYRAGILVSRKLSRKDALEYANKVLDAARQVSDAYVKEVNQGEMVAWAVRGLYEQLGEKVPAAVEERLARAKDLPRLELKELLVDAREHLGKGEDLDNHKDIDLSLQRMLGHLDPYTTYVDPETKQRTEPDRQGTFTGIGIQIRKDAERDMLQVVTPIKDSPAYKAGVRTGDVITTITREVDSFGKALDRPEVIPTKGLPMGGAVAKILGQPGTKVKLTVERAGEARPLEFEITRGQIELETVFGARRKGDDSWDYLLDPENRIGYARLNQFGRNSYRDLSRVVQRLSKENKLNGFVLDLRFNGPDGLLDSAVKIADLFIDDGLIVTVRPRVGQETPFYGRRENSYLDFPMVCLVNGGSACASEVVAACLQDHRRAIVVGEPTYGKGSLQNTLPFEQGELRVTTATLWRPSGKNLNKSSTSGREVGDWGVWPDIWIKLSRKERDDLADAQRDAEVIRRRDGPAPGAPSEFKDRQLDKALEYLRGAIKAARPGKK
jgi:C-terminal peptidase prc